MTANFRETTTTTHGVAVQVYRPGYRPSTVMLKHDANNFHCYFNFTPENARQLGENLIAESIKAEASGSSDEEYANRVQARLLDPSDKKLDAFDDLLHSLMTALPFVEDALDDPVYKAGNVTLQLNMMRAALRKAGAL